MAHAQAVTITGEGRMGLMYTSGGAGWSTENRLTLNFNVAVQADHGLSFGAWTRGRVSGRGATGVFSGSRVWVEASGLRLTFGNVDGAFRGTGVAFGYLGGCGVGYEGGQQWPDRRLFVWAWHRCAGRRRSERDPWLRPATGGCAQARIRVDYTMGSTRVSISNDNGGATDATEIGVRTTFDAWTVAAGYSTGPFGVDNVWTISGHYNGGSWGAGVIVASLFGSTNYSVLRATANLGWRQRLYGYCAGLKYNGASSTRSA